MSKRASQADERIEASTTTNNEQYIHTIIFNPSAITCELRPFGRLLKFEQRAVLDSEQELQERLLDFQQWADAHF